MQTVVTNTDDNEISLSLRLPRGMQPSNRTAASSVSSNGGVTINCAYYINIDLSGYSQQDPQQKYHDEYAQNDQYDYAQNYQDYAQEQFDPTEGVEQIEELQQPEQYYGGFYDAAEVPTEQAQQYDQSGMVDYYDANENSNIDNSNVSDSNLQAQRPIEEVEQVQQPAPHSRPTRPIHNISLAPDPTDEPYWGSVSPQPAPAPVTSAAVEGRSPTQEVHQQYTNVNKNSLPPGYISHGSQSRKRRASNHSEDEERRVRQELGGDSLLFDDEESKPSPEELQQRALEISEHSRSIAARQQSRPGSRQPSNNANAASTANTVPQKQTAAVSIAQPPSVAHTQPSYPQTRQSNPNNGNENQLANSNANPVVSVDKSPNPNANKNKNKKKNKKNANANANTDTNNAAINTITNTTNNTTNTRASPINNPTNNGPSGADLLARMGMRSASNTLALSSIPSQAVQGLLPTESPVLRNDPRTQAALNKLLHKRAFADYAALFRERLQPMPDRYVNNLLTQGKLFKVWNDHIYCGLSIPDWPAYIALEDNCVLVYGKVCGVTQVIWVVPLSTVKSISTSSFASNSSEDTVLVFNLKLNSAIVEYINECDVKRPLRLSHDALAVRIRSSKCFNFEAFDDLIDDLYDYADERGISVYKTTWVVFEKGAFAEITTDTEISKLTGTGRLKISLSQLNHMDGCMMNVEIYIVTNAIIYE